MYEGKINHHQSYAEGRGGQRRKAKQIGQINPQAKKGYFNLKRGDTYVYINLKPDILDLWSELVPNKVVVGCGRRPRQVCTQSVQVFAGV